MDADSKDGTREWLKSTPNITSIIQKDGGMYDAVNKGWLQANGQIVSYLNCDEQYLPGTLAFVLEFFRRHPKIDIVFGDALLVKPDGTLLSYRKSYQPRWVFIATSHLYVLTCTMFMRRRIIDDGFLFDTNYKIIGDSEFVIRLLRAGYEAAHISRFFSTFTMTGSNLSYDKRASVENRRLQYLLPWWLKVFKYPLNLVRLIEKSVNGAYFQKKTISYEIYSLEQFDKRRNFVASTALYGWKWPNQNEITS